MVIILHLLSIMMLNIKYQNYFDLESKLVEITILCIIKFLF